VDIAKFKVSKRGRLIEIGGLAGEWAFVPDPLPPQDKFPDKLWPFLVEAREALGRLDGIGRTLPDPLLLLRPLQDREALRSSSLEGTYATPEELLLYEMAPRRPTSERDRANDWREVSNYGAALREGCSQLDSLPICLRVIRSLHKVLLKDVRGRNKSPGEFRKCQVYIGSERRYVPPPPTELGDSLDAFEKHLHTQDPRYDPLARCYLVHYQFEAIHPFIDGNGRVGRLLLALMTYKWCNLAMPWLYMSAFFERYKDEYTDRLFRVSTEGAWAEWLEFCLRGTIEQANDSIRRCELLQNIRKKYHKLMQGSSKRDHAIVEGLFRRPIVTIPSMRRAHHVTYPTASADVRRLVGLGILVELAGRHPKTFYARDIFHIAYDEPTD